MSEQLLTTFLLNDKNLSILYVPKIFDKLIQIAINIPIHSKNLIRGIVHYSVVDDSISSPCNKATSIALTNKTSVLYIHIIILFFSVTII